MQLCPVAADGYFRFRCPSCARRLKGFPEQAGRHARCPCGHRLEVPTPGSLTAQWHADPPSDLPLVQDARTTAPPSGQHDYVNFFHAVLNSLPPLHAHKSPTLAAILGLWGGGVALGIYFRSFIDLIILVFEALLITVLLSCTSIPAAQGTMLGYALGVMLASIYGYFRALNSNRRLGPRLTRSSLVSRMCVLLAFLWPLAGIVLFLRASPASDQAVRPAPQEVRAVAHLPPARHKLVGCWLASLLSR